MEAYVRFMIMNLKAGDGACENTKVGCFVCDCLEMQLLNGAAVTVSMPEASVSQK